MSAISKNWLSLCICLLAVCSVRQVDSQINYVLCGTSLTYNYAHDASGPSNEVYQFFVSSGSSASNPTYQNSQRCMVTLQAQSWPAYLTVVVNQLDLEFQQACSFDWLCLNGIRFCGSRSGSFSYSYLVPAYETFTLRFWSDNSNVRTGFTALVTSRRAASQDIASHPVGVSFAPNQTSTTNIRNTTLSDLDNYVDYCRKDFVAPVFSPVSSTIYCGNSSNNPQRVNALDCENNPKTVQLFSFPPTASSGYINNDICQIQFETQDKPVLMDVFLDLFDLEFSTTCNLDAVCIKGIKFCGRRNFNHTYSYIVPAHESFTFRFTSDSSQTYTGFKIRVTTRRASVLDIAYQPSGVLYASDDYSITAGTPVTINNLANYTDSCRPNRALLLTQAQQPDRGRLSGVATTGSEDLALF